MANYEKGSFGYLLEKAREHGFNSIKDWDEWKRAKKEGFDNVKDWNDWKNKKSNVVPRYNPCSQEFQEEAKKLKLTPWQYRQKLIEQGKLVNPTNIKREEHKKTIKNVGFENWHDYNNYLAQNRGYKDHTEYMAAQRWNNGNNVPMSENQDCTSYIGIHIGENIAIHILIEIFGCIENRMRNGYPWYEYIVNGGYKVNIKTSTLSKGKDCWAFDIGYNSIVDYFLFIAFDNTQQKNIIHIWLIEKNEMVRKGKSYTNKEKLYNRKAITVPNNVRSLAYFQKYEWTNKLKCIKYIQNKLKEDD